MPRVLLAMIGFGFAAAAATAAPPPTTTVRSPSVLDRLPAPPSIASVAPPGATIGGETTWKITGQNLKDVKTWVVSGGGVEVLETKFDPKESTVKVRVNADATPGFRELRAMGPGGMGNFAVVRLDSLAQSNENEPNDKREQAQAIKPGAAVCGILQPRDLDYYTFSGKKGDRIVIEVEARRLGSSLSPVVTIQNELGVTLGQERETPGADKDCRLAYALPSDGKYFIQVRDHIYRGDPQAAYRLRLESGSYASYIHPLGGKAGSTIEVALGGGNLEREIKQTVSLPDLPGSTFEPAPIATEHGTILPPGKLMIGDGDERDESAMPATGEAKPAALGSTINGRVAEPGEIDHYSYELKKGAPVRFQIVASPLGSWLDSVLLLHDAKGNVVAENDDAGMAGNRRVSFGLAGEIVSDSSLEFEAPADGTYTLDVTDRFGEGGPEYGYRLESAPTTADFAIRYTFGASLPQPNQPVVINNPNAALAPSSYAVRPGGKVEVPFAIIPLNFNGAVEVRAVGLPPGLKADAVKLEVKAAPPGNNARQGRRPPAAPVMGKLVVLADPYAAPVVGALRLRATATPELVSPAQAAKPSAAEKAPGDAKSAPAPASEGSAAPSAAIERMAYGLITFGIAGRPNAALDPIRMRVDHVPIAIVGEPLPKPTGPSKTPTIAGIHVPGALLQGNEISLTVVADPPSAGPTERFYVEVETENALGLRASPLVSESKLTLDPFGAIGMHGTIKLAAAVGSPLGVHSIKVRLIPELAGPVSEQSVAIIVHPPGRLRVVDAEKPLAIKKGGAETIGVFVEREQGISTTLNLSVKNPPAGYRQVGRSLISANQSFGEIKLERLASAPDLPGPVTLQVVGLARMAAGPVEITSVINPRIIEPAADK